MVHFVVMKKLTAKQEEFARLVGTEGLSQAEAYRRAYDCENMADPAVTVAASRLAANANVSLRINGLKASRILEGVDSSTFTVKKLMDAYLAIAFVDPNELISQRVGACRHCWGIGGQYQWKESEYLKAVAQWEMLERDPKHAGKPMPDPAGGFGYRFTAAPNPECVECEGEGVTRIVPKDTTTLSPGALLLYRGVQQTKDGVKVMFGDRDNALEKIGRIIGAFDDKLRIELEAKVASYKLTTNDPAEAAEAYRKMLDGSVK